MKNKPIVDKANNSTMGVPHARQRMMAYFQFSMIALVFVLVFGIVYAISLKKEQKNKIDYSTAQLIQFDLPADDAPVVVYETDKGTFKAVLFPDEAPKYCEYFTELVNSGYYDGTYVFAVQEGVYFMAGSKTSDGLDDDNTDKSQHAPEKSKDLWPFYGAVAGYGNQKSMFDSTIQAGSRDLFIGSIEFTDEIKEQLDSASDNTLLNNAFKDKGGVPNFSQQYTIFAQVYDGFEAYDQLLKAAVVNKGDDSGNNADLRPTEALRFNKVYMSTYGENKNDVFFSTDARQNSENSSSSAE